jgi:hypothetical protein
MSPGSMNRMYSDRMSHWNKGLFRECLQHGECRRFFDGNEGDPEECKVKIRTYVILAACLDCCREPYAQPESAVSPLLPLQTAGDT